MRLCKNEFDLKISRAGTICELFRSDDWCHMSPLLKLARGKQGEPKMVSDYPSMHIMLYF